MFLLLTSLAWADVIPPRPECSDGATARSSHAGEWCELADAAACLCVVEDSIPCGGRRPPAADPCMVDRKVVKGACGPGGECAEGTCSNADACATEPPLKPPVEEAPKAEEAPTTEAAPGSEDGCAHVPLASGALGLALIGLAGVTRRRG